MRKLRHDANLCHQLLGLNVSRKWRGRLALSLTLVNDTVRQLWFRSGRILGNCRDRSFRPLRDTKPLSSNIEDLCETAFSKDSSYGQRLYDCLRRKYSSETCLQRCQTSDGPGLGYRRSSILPFRHPSSGCRPDEGESSHRQPVSFVTTDVEERGEGYERRSAHLATPHLAERSSHDSGYTSRLGSWHRSCRKSCGQQRQGCFRCQ